MDRGNKPGTTLAGLYPKLLFVKLVWRFIFVYLENQGCWKKKMGLERPRLSMAFLVNNIAYDHQCFAKVGSQWIGKLFGRLTLLVSFCYLTLLVITCVSLPNTVYFFTTERSRPLNLTFSDKVMRLAGRVPVAYWRSQRNSYPVKDQWPVMGC